MSTRELPTGSNSHTRTNSENIISQIAPTGNWNRDLLLQRHKANRARVTIHSEVLSEAGATGNRTWYLHRGHWTMTEYQLETFVSSVRPWQRRWYNNLMFAFETAFRFTFGSYRTSFQSSINCSINFQLINWRHIGCFVFLINSTYQ